MCVVAAYQKSILHPDLAHTLLAHAMFFLAFVCGASMLAKLIGFCHSVRHGRVPKGGQIKSSRSVTKQLKGGIQGRNETQYAKSISKILFEYTTSFFHLNFRQQPPATRCAWHAPHKAADEAGDSRQETGEAKTKWNDNNNEADDDEVGLQPVTAPTG